MEDFFPNQIHFQVFQPHCQKFVGMKVIECHKTGKSQLVVDLGSGDHTMRVLITRYREDPRPFTVRHDTYRENTVLMRVLDRNWFQNDLDLAFMYLKYP